MLFRKVIMIIAYMIVSIFIFLFSAMSNIIYLSSNDTENKFSAALGLTIFISMICWTIAILVDM